MNEQQTAEEQEVRELIAGAGPRAAVPAEDVATIKAAAREEWREMVERERRLRRSWRLRGAAAVAAGVLLALAVGWWWTNGSGPMAAPVVASVELVAGSVRTGEAVELQVGGELTAGTAVETAGWTGGPAAGAALRLAGGSLCGWRPIPACGWSRTGASSSSTARCTSTRTPTGGRGGRRGRHGAGHRARHRHPVRGPTGRGRRRAAAPGAGGRVLARGRTATATWRSAASSSACWATARSCAPRSSPTAPSGTGSWPRRRASRSRACR